MNQEKSYNLSNPTIKRIMKEVREMEKEKNSQFHAIPVEVYNIIIYI